MHTAKATVNFAFFIKRPRFPQQTKENREISGPVLTTLFVFFHILGELEARCTGFSAVPRAHKEGCRDECFGLEI
jgi:hypothetical protein